MRNEEEEMKDMTPRPLPNPHPNRNKVLVKPTVPDLSLFDSENDSEETRCDACARKLAEKRRRRHRLAQKVDDDGGEIDHFPLLLQRVQRLLETTSSNEADSESSSIEVDREECEDESTLGSLWSKYQVTVENSEVFDEPCSAEIKENLSLMERLKKLKDFGNVNTQLIDFPHSIESDITCQEQMFEEVEATRFVYEKMIENVDKILTPVKELEENYFSLSSNKSSLTNASNSVRISRKQYQTNYHRNDLSIQMNKLEAKYLTKKKTNNLKRNEKQTFNHDDPHQQTDLEDAATTTSFATKQYLEKHGLIPKPTISSTVQNESSFCRDDNIFSFASRQYLERHGLIKGKKTRKLPILKSSRMENQMTDDFILLNIEKLKEQPKLL